MKEVILFINDNECRLQKTCLAFIFSCAYVHFLYTCLVVIKHLQLYLYRFSAILIYCTDCKLYLCKNACNGWKERCQAVSWLWWISKKLDHDVQVLAQAVEVIDRFLGIVKVKHLHILFIKSISINEN